MSLRNVFTLFGNPIKHSYSPEIHKEFQKFTGIHYVYQKHLVQHHNFEKKIKKFFNSGGSGANITTPFKKRSLFLCDYITKRAFMSRSINTIKRQSNGSLLGDDTDGIGLIYDLNRLQIIKKNSKLLLIGSGGAATSAINYLLNFGCNLTITNRTLSKAFRMAKMYQSYKNKIQILPMKDITKSSYNLVINATSCGIYDKIPNINYSIINKNVFCYDMFYKKNEDTPFLMNCRKQGASHCFDGFGMLIAQAAHTFLLWHGIFPCINEIYKKLNKNF
ncbi:MAG: shikimate dehydrogenase [Wigglesworthia glossinidia]|nr:shikimate dehydrogenase [Wigglesworthia glossinidia]